MKTTGTTRIHLARPGTFRDVGGRKAVLSDAVLKDLADSYDAETYRAPLVLGHPADGAPAYGWVDRLEVGSDGGLYGEVGEVASDLADAVQAGHYRNVSISFWPKGHENSPAPDGPSLRHVGVLGAQAPAIKGLMPLEFVDDAEIVTVDLADNAFGWRVAKDLFRGMRDWMLDQFGQEQADRILPSYMIDNIEHVASEADETKPVPAFEDPSNTPQTTPPATTSEDPMSGSETKPATTDLAEREANLAEREAALNAREAEVAEKAEAARKTAAVSFADGLIADGKLAPAGKDVIVAMHRQASGTEEPIALSDGKTQSLVEGFEALFKGAKPIIDLAEHSADDDAETIDGASAGDLERRAKKLQEEDTTLSFSEAIRRAEKEAAA